MTVAIVIMVGAGAASGVLANIPFVAVMLVMVKGYLVTAEWLPEIALAPHVRGLAVAGYAGVRGHEVRRHPRR